MARAEIDPQLPYIQVHRSVGQKAALLAPLIGVTYQHVRGAMDCLWESLADRRLLAGRNAIILPAAAIRARLKLAFGMEVDLELLVLVGFLEPDGAGYRVRGMSRYIETEQTRQNKKDAAGKKAPVPDPDATGVPPGSDPPATGAQPGSDPSPTPHTPGSNPAKARGERREVRDERREDERGEVKPPPPEPESAGISLKDRIEEAWFAKRGAPYRWRSADDNASREILAAAGGDWARVLSVWARALDRTTYPRCVELRDLSKHWNAYAGDEPSKATELDVGATRTPAAPRAPYKPPASPPCAVCGAESLGEWEGVRLCQGHQREATRSDLVHPEHRRPVGEDIGTWVARKRPGPDEAAA